MIEVEVKLPITQRIRDGRSLWSARKRKSCGNKFCEKVELEKDDLASLNRF